MPRLEALEVEGGGDGQRSRDLRIMLYASFRLVVWVRHSRLGQSRPVLQDPPAATAVDVPVAIHSDISVVSVFENAVSASSPPPVLQHDMPRHGRSGYFPSWRSCHGGVSLAVPSSRSPSSRSPSSMVISSSTGPSTKNNAPPTMCRFVVIALKLPSCDAQ